ncbi:hypothetical protein [Streptomyces olivaceus]|uniref:hypothetical protein n=1 Tax=Streptomyces olivaceus TaxID=47716 RepID=UPI003717ED2E
MADAYKNAHNAVRAERGPASLWQCCWCWGDAEHWSYDHADENERVDGRRRYSLDVNCYQPMCARDHRVYDRLHRENAPPERVEREMARARYRYPRETVAAMCERRANRLHTYVIGKRRTAPLTVIQTTIQRVMT